jgi:hypothetical protein
MPNACRRQWFDLVRILVLAAGLMGAALAPAAAGSRVRLDIEAGPAWQTRNDFAVPGDTGSRASLDASGAVGAFRATLIWDFAERWSARALVAPLATDTAFTPDSPFLFNDETFPADTSLDVHYRFDSFRMSLFYRFRPSGRWSFRAGGTLKLRKAMIQVSGGGQSSTRDDTGIVPLFYGGARYEGGGPLAVDFELDALGAPQGRAIDFSTRGEWRLSESLSAYLGYRILDGGADNDEVYTFATFHYLLAGVEVRF